MKSSAKQTNKGLFLRGSTYYMKFSYYGVDVRESCKTSDPILASQLVDKRKHDIYDRVLNPQKYRVTAGKLLSVVIENTYRERWVNNKSKLQSYKQAYMFIDVIGDLPVTEINTERVREYKSKLRAKGIAEATINRYVSALSTCLHYEAEVSNIELPKFEKAKERTKRVITYTPEELLQITNWFTIQKQSVMTDLVLVLYDTGLRLSEALAIGVDGNKTEYKGDHITSWENKGDAARTILTTKRVRAILDRYPAGFGITKSQADHQWNRMRKALPLDAASVIHCLRHSCATRLLAGGMGLNDVKVWMGHKSITTTERYLHCIPGAKKSAIKILEED